MRKWRNNNGEEDGIICFDILPPRIWHRRRSIVCRHAVTSVTDVRNGYLTTDKRGPKLDMLNYSSTYVPGVSYVEETLFASDKSPLKHVALTFLSVGQWGVDNATHVKCCKNNDYDQFEQLTPPKYMAQPYEYDQNATADRA